MKARQEALRTLGQGRGATTRRCPSRMSLGHQYPRCCKDQHDAPRACASVGGLDPHQNVPRKPVFSRATSSKAPAGRLMLSVRTDHSNSLGQARCCRKRPSRRSGLRRADKNTAAASFNRVGRLDRPTASLPSVIVRRWIKSLLRDLQALSIDPSIESREPGRVALPMMSSQLLPRARRFSMVGPTGSP